LAGKLVDQGGNQEDSSVVERVCTIDRLLDFRGTDLLRRSTEARSVPERWISVFPDFRFELLDAIEQVDRVALWMSLHGTPEVNFFGFFPTRRSIHAAQTVLARRKWADPGNLRRL